jgi:hypothetical protein
MTIRREDFFAAATGDVIVDEDGRIFDILENRCVNTQTLKGIPVLLVKCSVHGPEEFGWTEGKIINEHRCPVRQLNSTKAYIRPKDDKDEVDEDLIFPGEYLNEGSDGSGAFVLQLLLKAGGYAPEVNLTGVYRDKTREAVKRLQRDFGFEGEDVDGHFGPNTRKAYFEKTGINVNALRKSSFTGMTRAVVPENVSDR